MFKSNFINLSIILATDQFNVQILLLQ